VTLYPGKKYSRGDGIDDIVGFKDGNMKKYVHRWFVGFEVNSEIGVWAEAVTKSCSAVLVMMKCRNAELYGRE